MTRADGCRVWDEDGREYVDFVMALGAVALGYGPPDVSRAATAAIAAGVVGPLPPIAEEALAEALAEKIPWLERVRFLKTGAEAVAAAVRLARVATGRDEVLGCGYHGWLDWSQGATEGVPAAVRHLFAELPFNDVAAGGGMIRARAGRLAAVVGGPVMLSEAAGATLEVFARDDVCGHLHRIGTRLLHGLHEVQRAHSSLVTGVAGIAEMCFLHCATEDLSRALTSRAAERGLLFKRTAYNFVSLAHDEGTVDRALAMLHEALRAI